MNRWYRRHRGAVLTALCALALALLALAPAGALRLADALRLGRVQTLDAPYAPRPVTHDDFYLLRQLDQRESALNSGDDSLLVNTASAWSALVPTYDEDLRSYVREKLGALVQGGALPEAWVNEVLMRLFDNPQYGPLALYRGADALGFVTILGLVPGWDDRPVLRLVIEGRSDQVVGVWLMLPAVLASPEEVAQGADKAAYLRLLGLDAFTDWAAPENTPYADVGLYSAAANALVTSCLYADDGWPALSLDLTTPQYPLDFNIPGDAAAAARAPFPLEGLRGIGDRSRSGAAFEGTVGYDLVALPGEGALLIRTDYATGQTSVLCERPDCRHRDASCPAWLPYREFVYPVPADGGLYLLHAAHSSEETRLKYAAVLEDLGNDRGSEDFFRSMADCDWLARCDPAAGAVRLAELPPEYEFSWTDGQALYGLPYGEGENATTRALMRVALADGVLTEWPNPHPGTPGSLCEPLGAWQGQFVMGVGLPAEPVSAYAGLASTGQLWDLTEYEFGELAHLWVVLWDPLSGACRPVAELPQDVRIEPSVYGDELWLYTASGDRLQEERVDLASGERRVAWQDDTGGYVYGATLPWLVPETPGGPVRWLIVCQFDSDRRPSGQRITVCDLQAGTVDSRVITEDVLDMFFVTAEALDAPDGGRLLLRRDDGSWLLTTAATLLDDLDTARDPWQPAAPALLTG